MGDLHGVGGPSRWALMPRAAATSVGLSVLFAVVYGSTNWFTAQRPDSHVGTWYFAWELTAVPFVPLLYVPYMSLDLFFFGAPFLCRDQREIQVFARRMVFSIAVAAAFFLLLPLELAWPPLPRAAGWMGDFVDRSSKLPFLLEYPHNLFPSLHITLCMIVADTYTRHTRGMVKIVLLVWFWLIGVGTLLTWQHHIVDIAGGALLGAFAFHLFREDAPRLPVSPNFRIGGYYIAGAIAVLLPAPWAGPWGAFLLWPAAGLGMVAFAYFGRGPGIFRKSAGRLPLSTRFVLVPVLIGQYLSLIYYRRQCHVWDEASPGVLIGRVLSNTEAAAAVKQGVTAVLDLTAEFAEAEPFLATRYYNTPVLDLTAPTQDQLREAVALIAEESSHGVIYVHCKIGYSRTAATVGAYLLASGQSATADEAIERLRLCRPSIIVRPETIDALRAFDRSV